MLKKLWAGEKTVCPKCQKAELILLHKKAKKSKILNTKGLIIYMNTEMMMGLVIISIVAVIMVIIGISQFSKKENPIGFYNVIDPPKKEEISDVIQWNKKHGVIWIVYGICIEIGFCLGYIMPSEVLEMIFMMGGVIIPLPFMVLRHRALEKEYKINTKCRI